MRTRSESPGLSLQSENEQRSRSVICGSCCHRGPGGDLLHEPAYQQVLHLELVLVLVVGDVHRGAARADPAHSEHVTRVKHRSLKLSQLLNEGGIIENVFS